jgi:class 3 adenylate cyclase
MAGCPTCGTGVPGGTRFCPQCGTPVRPPAGAIDGERKVVTALFCDLVGFTAMSEFADPEDVDEMLHAYFAVARGAIERFGGVVQKFIGDAVVGAFGVPAAHEDDPERAVRAALRIVEDSKELKGINGEPLRLRVGVNTGEALVRVQVVPGSGEGFLAGDSINTASRLQSVAPPMGVAVGWATYRATAEMFDYVELERAIFKGKTDAVRAFQPLSPRARAGSDVTGRQDGPFVGRRRDLARLLGIFDKSVAAASPSLITVVGEPGLGKSRILAEMHSRLDDRPGRVTWRQSRCLPYGDAITFWALGEIVKAHSGVLDSDGTDVAVSKLTAVLPDSADQAWMRRRLLPLLGVEAEATAGRSEQFTAWVRFLEHIADAGPTVLVFEDLHWADESMLDFLEHAAAHAGAVPLLLVGTTRPELFERRPDYAAILPNGHRITLAPLSQDETTELMAGLLDGASSSATRISRSASEPTAIPVTWRSYSGSLPTANTPQAPTVWRLHCRPRCRP